LLPSDCSLDAIVTALEHHRRNPSASPDPEPLRRQPHSGSRPAAVLAVVFPSATDPTDTRILLTRRASRMSSHAGEVAFPGGRVDPSETLEDAALREAEEEVSLARDAVRIVGSLEPITTVISDSAITPFVAIADQPIDVAALRPSLREVERIFDVSLHGLTDPDCYHAEMWDYPDTIGTFPVFFFDVEGDTVWGATGRMLHRLLTLLLPR
jgi:8-oxo-dGTP pyrophosphatase MutT (NUDIX family)